MVIPNSEAPSRTRRHKWVGVKIQLPALDFVQHRKRATAKCKAAIFRWARRQNRRQMACDVLEFAGRISRATIALGQGGVNEFKTCRDLPVKYRKLLGKRDLQSLIRRRKWSVGRLKSAFPASPNALCFFDFFCPRSGLRSPGWRGGRLSRQLVYRINESGQGSRRVGSAFRVSPDGFPPVIFGVFRLSLILQIRSIQGGLRRARWFWQ